MFTLHGPLTSGAVDSVRVGVVEGEEVNGWLGLQVALSDLDDDGFDDVVTASMSAEHEAGRVYVVAGPVSGTVGVADAWAVVTGEAEGSSLGMSLTNVGDLDGDGIDDLATGTAYLDLDGGYDWDEDGAVYLFYGGTGRALDGGEIDAIDADARFTPSSDRGGPAALGQSLSGGRDVDGDGLMDLLVGSPGDNTNAGGAGTGWLLLGDPTAWTGDLEIDAADAALSGSAGDALGTGVAMVGDLDGDGLDDMAFRGTPSTVIAGFYFAFGLVEVVYGASSGLSGNLTSAATLTGKSGHFGDGVGLSGDYDQDGCDDLTIGATDTYVFYGPVSGTLGAADAGATLSDPVKDSLGTWVRGGVDWNDDGIDDLLLGGPDLEAAEESTGRLVGFRGGML